jgi:hypothetical protein
MKIHQPLLRVVNLLKGGRTDWKVSEAPWSIEICPSLSRWHPINISQSWPTSQQPSLLLLFPGFWI